LTWWTDYQARRGVDRKTLFTDNMKNLVSTEFENSTSYELVKISDVDRKTRIVEESSIIKNPNRKRLLCFPDETIIVGEIVVYDGFNWICVNNDTTSNISDVGIIERCNNTFPFYDSSSTLHTIPCIVSKGLISLDEQKIISTLDSEIAVQISNTSITRQIEINDVFKIGLRNYTVNDINDITIPGLLLLKMVYSEVSQETHTFVLTILNGSNLSIQEDNTLQLNVNVTDNGVLLVNPTITYLSSNNLICTVSSSGLVTSVGIGSCTINASANGVSEDIAVIVDASITDDYSVAITGSESIKINKTSTYTATVYNNGVIVSGIDCIWSLVGSYASINSQDGDNCVIIAGAISGNSVTLRATKSDDITIYKDLVIDIVGLW